MVNSLFLREKLSFSIYIFSVISYSWFRCWLPLNTMYHEKGSKYLQARRRRRQQNIRKGMLYSVDFSILYWNLPVLLEFIDFGLQYANEKKFLLHCRSRYANGKFFFAYIKNEIENERLFKGSFIVLKLLRRNMKYWLFRFQGMETFFDLRVFINFFSFFKQFYIQINVI